VKTAFILFMLLLAGAAMGVKSTADKDHKKELETCIMDQIELSEQNRGNYFPRMRNELLHGFIMDCMKVPSFRKRINEKSK
jgi:hypothetical protein